MPSTRITIDHPFQRFEEKAVEQSIPSRFHEQRKRCGSRVAVLTPDQSVTYEELDRAANRIARALLDRADSSGTPVALLLQDPVSMIAGMLGVLAAGRAYVPIDMNLPVDRCKAIIQESGADLLIAAGETIPWARVLTDRPAQIIDADEAARSPGRSDRDASGASRPGH